MKHLTPNRDSVTTINTDGSHFVLHPADTKGRFTNWRRITAVFLIGIYVLLPWVKINGYPAVFLDVLERRFHFFGITLAAQDLWLMFFLITGLAFSLFFVTAALGRVWCGWTCPQTVFLEHVYRRVERWIEGDSVRRRKLDAAPWNTEKILKRGSKHAIFLGLSAIIAHVFLAYFISIPKLYDYVTAAPSEHWGAFVFMFAATGILYFNFSWFREQLCIIICPYGRFQSALIDDDSVIIGYDETRGEPRGKATDPNAGACIDCNRCVQVCPTGIDIRQGLQLECIGCANCIDACDAVMDRLDRPRGLIRYDSFNGLKGLSRRFLRPRIFVYAFMLAVGATVMIGALSSIDPAVVRATRMTGSPYYLTDTELRNQFMVRLINKRDKPARFSVLPTAVDAPAGFSWSGFEESVTVGPMGEIVRPIAIQVPRGDYNGPFHIVLSITGQPVEAGQSSEFALTAEVEFLGPDPDLLRRRDAEKAEQNP